MNEARPSVCQGGTTGQWDFAAMFQFGKYICGDFLLCARLRTADKQPAGGAPNEIERIVERLRE